MRRPEHDLVIGAELSGPHKHFAPWARSERTVAFREFSRKTGNGGMPSYPKRLVGDAEPLHIYRRAAAKLTKISFLGRLDTCCCLDMDEVLDFGTAFIRSRKDGTPAPFLPNVEAP